MTRRLACTTRSRSRVGSRARLTNPPQSRYKSWLRSDIIGRACHIALVSSLALSAAAGAGNRSDAALIAFSGARAGDGPSVYTGRPDGSGRSYLGPASLSGERLWTAWSHDGRRVAFAGNAGIVIANADGSGRREVGEQVGVEVALSWSPDGRTLVAAGEGLFLIDAETGKTLTPRPLSGAMPSFSPNGRLIAFLRGGLFVMTAKGTSIRRLAPASGTSEDSVASPPSWSPDGRRIAFEYRGDIVYYDFARRWTGNLTWTAGRVETEPAWSPDGRWIAFVRGLARLATDTRTGVSIVRPDGSGLRVLTDERFRESRPTWSPDSRRIAFLGGGQDGAGASAAYVVGIKRGKARPILRHPCNLGERLSGLSWGPGGRVAFTSEVLVNDTQIYVSRTDGTDVHRPATSCANERTPAWSPDGGEIAYTRGKEVYVMHGSGAGKRRLGVGSEPGWSPDGKTIVLTRGTRTQLYAIPSAGGGQRQLTSAGANGNADWSPVAGRIAFTSTRDGRLEVYTMRPEGGDERRVTMLGGSEPSWAPDGTRIAYVLGPNIWTIRADGDDPVRLTTYDECTEVWDPAWSPDGTTIAFAYYSHDAEQGGIAFVPAAGGEVRWMRPDPLVGALGSRNQDAPSNAEPAWHPMAAATHGAAVARAGDGVDRTAGCIQTG